MHTKLALPRSQQLTNFIWHNPMNTKKNKKPWTTTHKLQDNEEEGDSPIPSTFTLVTRIDDLIMYQFDVQFLCKV